MTDENTKLRELLRRMREEADEAWRNTDPRSIMQVGTRRDAELFRDVEDLLGPSTWDALPPTVHVLWGEQAICHWTMHPPKRWPATQTGVPIRSLITQLPDPTDPTHVQYIANPGADWGGVTCDDCRIRLPSLLAELDVILDDLHEGIMQGYREDPETQRDQERYDRDVKPRRSPEALARDEAQMTRNRERIALRAARRARQGR